ncbi:hypothetical protein, partial [Bartonella raoultii]|uniref:hypothetical protein n=1 Tax=Bartonella raoultii TaxID=1457020 RepID=UPI001ABA5074
LGGLPPQFANLLEIRNLKACGLSFLFTAIMDSPNKAKEPLLSFLAFYGTPPSAFSLSPRSCALLL